MADKSKYGSFVATTNIYDIDRLQRGEPTIKDLKTVLVRLRQTINDIAISNNKKFSGIFVKEEFLNGNVWFKDPTLNSTTTKAPILRQEFQIVVDFGALPNTATKSVAHGLTLGSTWMFTRIYGCATDPSTGALPIPNSNIAH